MCTFQTHTVNTRLPEEETVIWLSISRLNFPGEGEAKAHNFPPLELFNPVTRWPIVVTSGEYFWNRRSTERVRDWKISLNEILIEDSFDYTLIT